MTFVPRRGRRPGGETRGTEQSGEPGPMVGKVFDDMTTIPMSVTATSFLVDVVVPSRPGNSPVVVAVASPFAFISPVDHLQRAGPPEVAYYRGKPRI